MRILRTIAFLLSVMFLSLHTLVQHEHHEKENPVTHFHAAEDVSNIIHLLISVIQENLGTSHLEDFVVDEHVTGVYKCFEACEITLPPNTTSTIFFITKDTRHVSCPAGTIVPKRGPPVV